MLYMEFEKFLMRIKRITDFRAYLVYIVPQFGHI